MDERNQAAFEAALVRLLADRAGRRGHSLRTISRATGICRIQLAAIARAAGIRYKHQHASPQQIQAAMNAVIRDGLTFRAAAAKTGISKTAVHRFVQRRRHRLTDAVGKVRFRHAKQAYRCPVHGLVNVVPCVACAAMGKSEGVKE